MSATNVNPFRWVVYLYRNGDWRRGRLEWSREDAERTAADWRKEYGQAADIRIEGPPDTRN